MERKKLLLISVSVGVFFVVTLGASILLFSPLDRENLIAAAPGTAVDVVEPVHAALIPDRPERNNGSVAAAAQNPAPADQTMITVLPPSSITIISNEGGTTAPNAATPNTAPSATTVATVAAAPPAATTAPSESAPRQKAQNTAKNKPSDAAASAKKAASATKKTALSSDYWVQAGSFSTKSRADDTKKYLATKGIGSIVTNTALNGKTYYRVRIGPYTSSNEAQYWLALVKSVDGCESAQVWKAKRP